MCSGSERRNSWSDRRKKKDLIQEVETELRELIQDEIKLRKRALLEVSRLAFVDIANFFNDDYTLKPITEIDEDTRAALAGIELLSTSPRFDIPEYTKKIKTCNKTQNLKTLLKHLGMLEKRQEDDSKDPETNYIEGITLDEI